MGYLCTNIYTFSSCLTVTGLAHLVRMSAKLNVWKLSLHVPSCCTTNNVQALQDVCINIYYIPVVIL